MTTLVMFSGGIDSTAMLVKLLTGDSDDLRVHHIHMRNREGRDEAEQRAVDSILSWCRERYRPFRTSESGLDFRGLEAIPIDYLSIAFVACQVAIDTPRCTRIATGALATDTDIENRSARKLGEPHVEWIYPVYGTPKDEIAAALPAELLDLTWSCRRPVGGARPCLVCKACKARQFAQGLRTPAEAAQNQIS